MTFTQKPDNNKKLVCLFLDDERQPIDTFGYTNNPIYINEDWVVVKNYNEFVKHVLENGVPHIFSADHDLADVHCKTFLTPPDQESRQEAWDKYHEEKDEDREMTGYDCLKWLIDHCHDNKVKFPQFLIHTMNQVGHDNMAFYYMSALRNRFISVND